MSNPTAYDCIIETCQRCGGTHPATVRQFTVRAGRHTHWAMCPVTVEPILICQVDGDHSDEVSAAIEKIRELEERLLNLPGVHAPLVREPRPEAGPPIAK